MLIILFPQRFVNCFYKSYQIGELRKKLKEKIEIHDMSISFQLIPITLIRGLLEKV